MTDDIYKKIEDALKEKSILERKDVDQIMGKSTSPSKHHVDYSIVKTVDGEIYEISTVFLDYWGKVGQLGIKGETFRDLDKSLEINPEAKPYETMVFKLKKEEKIHLIKLHYSSKEDAKRGHNTIKKLMWEQGPDLVKKLNLTEDDEWWRKYR